MPSFQFPFQITFPRLTGRTLPVAELRSPLLDPEMHEDGRVGVSFGPLARTQLTLDEFQIASVEAYVASQVRLREAMECELDKHHETWDPEKRFGRGPAVWAGVKVSHVEFNPRRLETVETIRRQGDLLGTPYADEDVERLLKYSDRPDTRARFTVALEGDWFDAHGRTVDFRDGEVVEFILDG